MNSKGFTIIELLVVIAMIGILSVIIVVQFGAGNQDNALNSAKALLKTDIRGAHTWAQGGRTCCSDTVPYGYGIVFTIGESTYDVYADLDSDSAYTTGVDEIMRAVDLAQEGVSDVTVTACSPDDGSGVDCDLFFKVPGAEMTVSGDAEADLSVTLTHGSSSDTETITVSNSTGQIE